VAESAVLQGRTALTQALMYDENDSQETAERKKARDLLTQAGKELTQVAKALQDRLKNFPDPTTPDQKAQKARLQSAELQARFNIAMNYFDQAQSYARNGKRELLLERSKKIESASKELEQFVGLDPRNPIKWRALAWLGRCMHEQGELAKARGRYAEVRSIAAGNLAAWDGVRLADYFRLLVIDEKPEGKENPQTLIEAGAAQWLRTYSRYVNTPEGCGVRWLQAKYLVNRAASSKDGREKGAYLQQARRVLASLEATENDYTDRARRKKIQIIGEQGGFTKKVADLKTFEDCYVRAQYEQYEMEKESEKLKATELEAARKQRLETISLALERGLGMPDAKDKNNLNDVNNARAMLTYFYLNEKKYEDCIRIGKTFAKTDPRSGQAIKCAAYALQAYAMLPNKTPDVVKDMVEFATYCKTLWKKELPGNLARHQLALIFLGENRPDEAIAELDAMTPDYPAYAATQMLLVDTASNLIRAGSEKAEEYKKQMLASLERTPEPVGMTGQPYQAYYFVRCRLADEMYNAKQYDRMQAIAKPLEAKLPTIVFDDDQEKNQQMAKYFTDRLSMIHAYSSYGKARLAMEKNEMGKVCEMLDPIVDSINDKKMDVLKSNVNLANAILDYSMKASIQQGKLDRTRLAVQAFQVLNEQGGDVPPILRQLVGLIRSQIDDLGKKGNQEALGKAITGFSAILDDLTKKQEKTNAEFQLLVAACYQSMTLFDKAVEELNKITAPPEGTDEKAREVSLYRAAQVQITTAQRLAKKFDEANASMKAIMGDKDKPGWGRKNLGALKEQTLLYMDQNDFASAYNVAAQVSGALLKQSERDPRAKMEYLDAYYNMCYSLVRLAVGQAKADQKKIGLDNAAQSILGLEKRYSDFGGSTYEQKFKDLIASDPDLKATYEALKMKQ
jgi:hypothetical protein